MTHLMKCGISNIPKMKINIIENKTSAEKDLLRVFTRLEKLDSSWRKSVPKGYKIWTPHNEIRLWSVPRNTGKLLKFLVMKTKAKTILELGTSAGYSTLWLAWGAKLHNGKVYTIELDETKMDMANENFFDSKMTDCITQIHGNIDEEVTKWNKRVDFIFFDAEKTKYLTYLKCLLPHLNRNGIIVADNAIDYADKMRNFLEFVETNKNLDIMLLNIDNGLLLIQKKGFLSENSLHSIMEEYQINL